MPRLSKARFIRLEYNWKKSLVSDEILDFQGIHTLLKMENGGGKSVLTQMLLSAYLPGRKRNFHARPFNEYFSGPKPTFLMQEWIKDQDAGFFCVGQMIRKAQSIREEEADDEKSDTRLDHTAWIAEYGNQDDALSLQNLQLVEEQPGGRRAFMKYADARAYLDSLSRSNPARFRLYNLNDSSQRKAYQSRLESLGIRWSEMGQLREFNQEESGISKFNSTYSTEEKLMRNVLIPAVVERLDADAGTDGKNGHIALFEQSFSSLLEEQKRNRQNLVLVDLFRQLKSDLETIQKQSFQRLDEQKDLEDTMHTLRLLYEGIVQAGAVFSTQEQDLSVYLEECRQELIRIAHQLLSVRFHQNHEQLIRLNGELETLSEQEKRKTAEVRTLEQENRKLRCASILDAMHKAAAREESARQKMKAAELSSEETARQQNAVGAGLLRLYRDDLKTADSRLTREIEQEKQEKARISEAQNQLQSVLHQQVELSRRQSSQQTQMKAYRKREEKFLKKNGLKLTHSLSFWEDEAIYSELESDLKDECSQAQNTADSLEREIQTIRSDQQNLQQTLQESRLNLQEIQHQIVQAEQKQAQLDEKVALRQKFLSMLGLQDEQLWDERVISQTWEQTVEQIRFSIASINRTISDLERQIRQLSTGTALELSEDFLEVMEELGLPVLNGTDLLRSWALPEAGKKELIAQHPFLPYSLILEEDQADRLIQVLQERKINTSMPIPIQSRESLNHPESSAACPRFYLRFNTGLIQTQTLEQMKEEVQTFLDLHRIKLANRQSELDDLQIVQAEFTQRAVSQKDLKEHAALQASLAAGKQKTEQSVQKLSVALEKARRMEQEKSGQLKTASNRLHMLTDRLAQFQDLITEYRQAAESWQESRKLEIRIEQMISDRKKLEDRISKSQEALLRWNRQVAECRNQKQAVEDLCDQFERFAAHSPAQGDRMKLEATFASLQAELDQSQSAEFSRQMEQARKEKNDRQKQLNKYLKQYDLLRDEIESIEPSDDLELENDERIADIQKDLKQLSDAIRQKTAEQSACRTNETNILEKMQEETGCMDPLEPSQIRSNDLEQEKEEVQAEAARTQSDLDDLKERHRQFDQIGRRLYDFEGLSDLTLSDDETIESLTASSLAEIEERLNESRRLFQQQKRILSTSRQRLKTDLEQLIREYEKDSELAEKALSAILERLDDLPGMDEEIRQKRKLVETLLASIETNLEKLHGKKDEVFQNLLGYLRSLNQQLKMIDTDTTIQIEQKHRKMLDIVIPDWDDHEAMYKEKLRAYIEDGLTRLETEDQNQDSRIRILVDPANLYNSIIGISSVRIRLYKIEEFSQSRIEWSQAGKLSGAEGFLCALTVILAVLNYQHKTSADLLSRQRGTSLLLLDNPFAYTQSAHIIETMMKLANNMKTQIVAFTNVDNAAVLNAFQNIYSLRMVPRYDGKNYLNVTPLSAPEVREAESVRVFLH